MFLYLTSMLWAYCGPSTSWFRPTLHWRGPGLWCDGSAGGLAGLCMTHRYGVPTMNIDTICGYIYWPCCLHCLIACVCMTTLFFCWPVASGSWPSPHGWDRGPDVMGLLACTFYTVNLVPTMNIGIRFAVVYTPLLLHICITLCCGINIHPKIRKKKKH